MRVEIIKPFEADSTTGRVQYKPGQIVAQGQKNWVDKGLAKEAPEPKADPKPAKNTASEE